MSEHAKLSPSASERWLVCSVAPAREEAFPDTSNDAADWGTAAHAMAEHCLTRGIDSVQAPASPLWDKYDGPEMRECVQSYLDFVRSKLTPTSTLFVEQRLSILPEFDIFGTADAIIVDGHTLRVLDLKGGKGVLVEADDNSQLSLYGWGALDSLAWLASEDIQFVEVYIVQPRRSNKVSKTFTAAELVAWMEINREAARRAYAAVAGDVATPGAHCRWCRARNTCRERAEYNMATAGFDFADECTPHDPNQLTEEQLAAIFLRLPTLEKWMKDIEAHVASLAHDHKVAGLKWVAGRSTRSITDEAGAVRVLTELGLKPYAEPKLLGVTEIGNRLKVLGFKFDDVLKPFVTMKQSPPVLVSEEDKRPEFSPAAHDFAEELAE
jgi:hypothetical protein